MCTTNAAISTITPSGAGATPVVGNTYIVTITATAVSGSVTYTYGAITGNTIIVGTITDYVTAYTTGKLIITAAA